MWLKEEREGFTIGKKFATGYFKVEIRNTSTTTNNNTLYKKTGFWPQLHLFK